MKENFLLNNNNQFLELNTSGKRIRAARHEKYLTIAELASQSGFSIATITNAENDKIKMQVNNLKTLSIILEKPIYYIGCFEDLPEETLGQRITKARLYHGQTKKEFATDLGIDVHTLRNWETDIGVPSKKYIKRLEAKFQILKT
jgi:transcriptional regulator with XRE-family HTH domain